MRAALALQVGVKEQPVAARRDRSGEFVHELEAMVFDPRT